MNKLVTRVCERMIEDLKYYNICEVGNYYFIN